MSRTEILKSFGLLVSRRRQEQGLSQEELAHRADLDRTYISGLERGVRNPSLTAVVKLADGLGVTIDVLLRGLGRDGGRKGKASRR